jgi:hypothetical protein
MAPEIPGFYYGGSDLNCLSSVAVALQCQVRTRLVAYSTRLTKLSQDLHLFIYISSHQFSPTFIHRHPLLLSA